MYQNYLNIPCIFLDLEIDVIEGKHY